ncbi:MAG: DUF4430 domain-containing protein [Candidatus Asgardarchaeum sp.]|nr:DUF4430 domain-containing protein [Candidatus Odinarchaeota archaeon]
MKIENLRILLAGLLLIVIISTLAFVYLTYKPYPYTNGNIEQKPNSEIKPAYNLTLIIDYGNGTIEVHYNLNLTNVPNITAFHILFLVATVNYTWYGDDVFVDAINGVWNNENDNNRWWQYWVDDELPMIAANHYYLKNNSVVAWRYWTPQV